MDTQEGVICENGEANRSLTGVNCVEAFLKKAKKRLFCRTGKSTHQ